jgi:hypothetical protein
MDRRTSPKTGILIAMVEGPLRAVNADQADATLPRISGRWSYIRGGLSGLEKDISFDIQSTGNFFYRIDAR